MNVTLNEHGLLLVGLLALLSEGLLQLVPPHPSHLRGWRTDQGSLFSLDLSLSSPRVLRSPTESLTVRNALFVAGLLVRLLPVLLSQYLLFRVSAPIGMVGTVAGDGAPRSCQMAVLRSPLDSPFSFSDSSLVGIRPFLLPDVSPCSRSARFRGS